MGESSTIFSEGFCSSAMVSMFVNGNRVRDPVTSNTSSQRLYIQEIPSVTVNNRRVCHDVARTYGAAFQYFGRVRRSCRNLGKMLESVVKDLPQDIARVRGRSQLLSGLLVFSEELSGFCWLVT